MLGLSVGGIVVLAIVVVALFTKFGIKIFRKVATVSLILLAVYLVWIWRGAWGPEVAPYWAVAKDMIRAGLDALREATKGPQ
jgi:hypothetical protein